MVVAKDRMSGKVPKKEFKKTYGIEYDQKKYGLEAVRKIREKKLTSAIEFAMSPHEKIIYGMTALYSAMRNSPKEIVRQRRSDIIRAIEFLFTREKEALALDKKYLLYFTYFRRALAQLKRG
ncbi:MAG: hypothetical protein PHH82_01115 [Candidatus ainarchaeum sp.]|nr:hypothetical protein [Candidatus ainarchaeum sp.]